MDPLSLIGGVASAGAIICGVTTVVQQLAHLREKYGEADLTLNLIISELMTVKAALLQIQAWMNDANRGPIQHDLAEALRVSLEGCKDSLDLLAEDITALVGDAPPSSVDFSIRARMLWSEPTMKEHQMRLHTQIAALQLLLQAIQVRNLPGQAAFIRQPRALKLIEQVKDDSSSVRTRLHSSRVSRVLLASRQDDDIGADDSITLRSETESSIGSTVFPHFDRELISTAVYRNHGRQVTMKHLENEMKRPGTPESQSPTTGVQRIKPPQPRIDTFNIKRFPSQGRKHSPLTPTSRSPEADSQKKDPFISPVSVIEPDRLVLVQQFPVSPNASHKRSTSDQKPGLRARFISSFSRVSLSPQPTSNPSPTSPISPTSATRRSQRKSKTQHDRARSIDLGADTSHDVPPVVRVVQLGSIWDLETLLDRGVDLDVRHQATGRTALAVAAHCGFWKICDLLISHGANVEAVDVDGNSPLHLAVEHEHVEAATLLLQHGARLHVRDRYQATPLHKAVKLGDYDMVLMLLLKGADVEAKDTHYQCPIHYAAARGDVDVIDVLLGNKRFVDCSGQAGMTPLMVAAKYGQLDAVNLLLKKKALLKAKGEGGWQALHYAAWSGQTDIISAMLARKAPIDVRTADERTPMMLSCASASFASAELLMRKGAQVEAQCAAGKRAIHYACEADARDVVQLLIGANVDVEAASHAQLEGRRPIHISTANGNADILQLLLSKGASIDARDAAGARSLCLAAANGHIVVLELLLKHGAAVRQSFDGSNAVGREESPLCLACKHGHLDAANLLITAGASIRQRDEQGWQPLRHAAHYGRVDVVQMLLARGALDVAHEDVSHTGAIFSTFAPEVDEESRAVVAMLLQTAEAERATSTAQGAVELGATSLQSPIEMPVGTAHQRPETLHRSTTIQHPSIPHQEPVLNTLQRATTSAVPTIRTQSQSSSLRRQDSTYQIQWPMEFNNGRTSSQSTTTTASSTTPRRRFTGPLGVTATPTTTAPAPARGHTTASMAGFSSFASAAAAGRGDGTMVQQQHDEQDLLRSLRCEECVASAREVPDLACALCRRNVLMQRFEGVGVVGGGRASGGGGNVEAGDGGVGERRQQEWHQMPPWATARGEVFEMDVTS